MEFAILCVFFFVSVAINCVLASILIDRLYFRKSRFKEEEIEGYVYRFDSILSNLESQKIKKKQAFDFVEQIVFEIIEKVES